MNENWKEILDRDKNRLRNKLIENGVKNLHEFGYTNANNENILNDFVYRSMFKTMLKESSGISQNLDIVINELLIEIK